MITLINKTKNTIIATNAKIADTFISRMVGLLNRQDISQQEALIITKCNSIHMFFMRFAIDVVFVDKKNKVVGLVPCIKPYQLSRVFWRADKAIELKSGAIKLTNISLNDEIVFEKRA